MKYLYLCPAYYLGEDLKVYYKNKVDLASTNNHIFIPRYLMNPNFDTLRVDETCNVTHVDSFTIGNVRFKALFDNLFNVSLVNDETLSFKFYFIGHVSHVKIKINDNSDDIPLKCNHVRLRYFCHGNDLNYGMTSKVWEIGVDIANSCIGRYVCYIFGVVGFLYNVNMVCEAIVLISSWDECTLYIHSIVWTSNLNLIKAKLMYNI